MAKKAAAEPIEETLEQPAGDDAPGEATTPAHDWPESTERRELPVKLTETAQIEKAVEYVHAQRAVENAIEAKKHAAKMAAKEIEEMEKARDELGYVVETGKTRQMVHCRWVFESNGLDGAGLPLHHSAMKTLVREDTGEVVEIKPISEEDRQMILPLSEEESAEAAEAFVKAAGYEVREALPEDGHALAFSMFGGDGKLWAILADSIAGAWIAAKGLVNEIWKAENSENQD